MGFFSLLQGAFAAGAPASIVNTGCESSAPACGVNKNACAPGPGPWRTLGVGLAAFLLLFVAMERPASIYDEGIVLTAALQMMHGAVVHRDFHTLYGPGSYAVVAALFSLLRPSFIVARVFAILVQAGIVAMTFAMLYPRTRKSIAYGASVVGVMWLVASKYYLYPTFPCIALAFCSAMILLRPNALRSNAALFAAGGCCGLSAYFRYDAGFFTLLAEALPVALALTRHRPGRSGLGRNLRSVAVLGAGAAAVLAPGAILYLLTSPFDAFYADVIDYSLRYYARMRGLPFPGVSAVIRDPSLLGIYLPLYAGAAALPMAWRDLCALADGASDDWRLPPSLLFCAFSLILYYNGVVRVSTLHLLLSIMPALILLALVVDRWWTRAGGHRIAAVILAALTALSAAVAVYPTLIGLRLVPRLYVAGAVAEHAGMLAYAADVNDTCRSWSGMRLAWLSPKYAAVSHYVAAHSAKDERILVAPDRNDRFYVNPLMLYFAVDRLPGTRFSEYDPGVQTRADVQRTMIAELIANHVRFIVRDSSFDAINEPNKSGQSSGVFLLDAYIDGHYRLVGRYDEVQVWLRNDVQAPSVAGDPDMCRLQPP
jgi:hypothetical protein